MSSSIFSSSISEHRWVDQFNEHFIIYIDSHPSIFRVPKNECDMKPEAYAPQQIGLGAYHHLRSDLDEMERKKLDALKKFLKPHQYKNFKSLIVDKVKMLEPSIRSCYNKYLDLDGDTLAWIMSIDGIYLLHLLSTYTREREVDNEDRNVAQDIIMLENQIPAVVLKAIKKALQSPDEDKENDEQGADEDEDEEKVEDEYADEDEEDEDEEEEDEYADEGEDDEDEEEYGDEDDKIKYDKDLNSEFLSFWSEHFPLETGMANFVDDTTSPHLLGCMYNLIMQSWIIENTQVKSLEEAAGTLEQIARAGADLTGLRFLMLLANLPLQKFAALFKKDPRTGNSSMEKIQIPSVSELDEVSKVSFEARADSCIGIKYDENSNVLYLPVITLNTDSEVILRNLVAYEVARASPKKIIAGYMDFMCGIIDTAKDVDLLKKNGIIKGNLADEEIAKIFNGISKSSSQDPSLEQITQKLNMIYNNTFRVKTLRFTRDHFVPSEVAVKTFLALLLIALLTVQAFCQVYGCSARWFGRISSIEGISSV